MSSSNSVRERGPSLVVRLRARAQAVQRRLGALRTVVPVVDAAFVVQSRDRAVAGSLLACAVAYRLFIWLLPVALLIAAALGFVQAVGRGQPEQIGRDLGLTRWVISAIASAAKQAERSRWILLALALIGVYAAGTSAAKTLTAVHKLAWGMLTGRPRSSLLAPAAFTSAALVAMGVVVCVQYLRREAPGVGLMVALAIGFLYALLWLGASIVLPHGNAPWTRLMPGALVFGVGMQLVHVVTVYYLSDKIRTASELYGGLGVAATLLFGLYLLARLIVAAALVNAVLWERAKEAAGANPA